MGEMRARWRDGRMHWRLVDYRHREPRLTIARQSDVTPRRRTEMTRIYWPGVKTAAELAGWTFFGGFVGALKPIVLEDASAGSPIVWKSALLIAGLTGLAAVYQRFKPVPRDPSKAPPAADAPATPPPDAH